MKYKSRNDIPEKYKVDLTELFKNENDFIKEIKSLENEICEI